MEQQAPLTNASSFLPSPADLLMAVPRLLSRASALGEHLDILLDKVRAPGSVIAEPTMANMTNATVATISGKFVQESIASAATASVPEDMSVFQALKNVGTFFSYITSKWAIATFTIAILLNRTHFYASSRVPLSFDRIHLRVALYLLPMMLFLYRISTILEAIHCQTAPNWSTMQYGASGKMLDTDFGGEGGFLWRASSTLLFWESAEESCRAVNMLPVDPGSTRPAGSLALLWPLFVSLGFGQFIETMSCALQGRHPIQEVGMTIFEHSLAFAEAEAVVTRPLTVDSTRFYKPKTLFTPDGSSLSVTRSTLSSFANVPPEVLLIALISSFSHFTSSFLAIVGYRTKFRLVTTGIWGLAYMSTFAWSFLRFATAVVEPGQHVGILRFPTVCIVGFIPHLLIIAGITACGVIYLLAFGLTVLSPPGPPQNLSWRERVAAAYGNLHANIHLSAITPLTISWNEDFYTAILKVGFTVLTAASEAVYLNEGTRVNVHSMTWLEKKRLQDMLARRRRFRESMASVPSELCGDVLADGVETIDKPIDGVDPLSASGYARERKTRGANAASDASRAVGRDTGVGLQQRRGRWFLTYQFLRGISMLLMAIQARLILTLLQKLRITYIPRWLVRLAGPRPTEKSHAPPSRSANPGLWQASEPWLVGDDQRRVRVDNTFDAEAAARERLRKSGSYEEQGPQESEEHLSNYLYGWWKDGGKWGDVDSSGDYVPTEDDDTTSVISFATTTDNEWSDMEEDGQRTPTQSTYGQGRESTPLPESTLDLSRLSHLLDPKSVEDREEARLLSRHLRSPGVLTRSQYRKVLERDEAKLLTTSRYRVDGFPENRPLAPEEEEQLLEEFVLNRRNATGAQGASNGSWDTGAEGMGSEGPQCVVCQMSPRTVLVWPCGCLSLCDDCRVGLASKNYTTWGMWAAFFLPAYTIACAKYISGLHDSNAQSPAHAQLTPQSFMQPEPSKASPKQSSPQIAPVTSNTSSQHGLRDDDQQASPLLRHHEEPSESVPGSGARRDSTRSRSRDHGDADGAAGLNPTSPSPRNRIADYENALLQSAKKRNEGPAFEVIKSARKPDDRTCSIAKLPNEVLTHTLSHLSPNDLAAVSLVSKRFNGLVTTPHAWREAFNRYFPGPAALVDESVRLAIDDAGDTVRSEKRSFARLTALASWRSEYILRTRLLRSLARGKPVQMPSSTAARSGQTQTNASVIMYNAQTFTTINHIHATFGSGLNKRLPRLIHGADDVGIATTSDPTTGKVDSWGQGDPNFYAQFSERFPGVAEWGLGSGEVVGRPNVMDVSQQYGMIYGQGCPEGSCYYRATDEQRGHFVAEPTEFSMPEVGIPKLGIDGGAICCVWIAKSSTVPSLSEGLVGLLMGSASGVVTACSLGTDGLRGSRLQRGELTARWVLSPGVPIVAIAVDENYSLKRQAQNRIWATALNALGELFYLTKFPTRSTAPKGTVEEYAEYLAWLTGRSVYWNIVEPSRRTARPDPYNDVETDGSYSPRTSWAGMCLSEDQILAETKEIQSFLWKLPKDFRKSCLGWDMRRRLEVDFAGDDGNYAGEAIAVFECGLEEGDVARITRYTRWKTRENVKKMCPTSTAPQTSQTSSLFGGSGSGTPDVPYRNTSQRTRSSSYLSTASSPERASLFEEWRCSDLTFGGLKLVQLTTTAFDSSTFATVTMSEDPALGFSTASTASSPYASPMSVASQPASPLDIPGQRARFVAAGTSSGIVLLWDIRAPVSRNAEFSNTIDPVRIIYTESPEISCIALTALHIVIGGNDGLVQAWDPLASDMKPIRVLNSRFSSRARRRLVQAQASAQGVGINMFAAGAIVLDPDPTVLRGAVSLGNQIRYWGYSSSAADQYKSSKRRLRRSERGSNNANDRFAGAARVNLKDYIANEKHELEREKQERRRQTERMAGRFGIDLLGSEEEALAYATMLSQEAMLADEARRRESESSSVVSSDTVTPEPSIRAQSSSPTVPTNNDLDADIAEAIRLSLQDSPGSGIQGSGSPAPDLGFDIPIRYAKGKKSPPRSKASPTRAGKAKAGSLSKREEELSDLEFAMQLSLAEEASRKEAEGGDDEFPPLSPTPGGKGKGKARMM
ncbi:hypothetical protein K458DRAFT_483866 [Lentithecium fluviatile CBS 122367]|uniref:F-box domain-containing protein n=1 Tax=Lentithecium fluviatile CBS 122367 TaxID=1168545 RepID=A0A6G1JJ22_9PLEO|nr:hypothetical protein K458DRAFT_483866 [Lentithecium fluviatile CBS 122367]